MPEDFSELESRLTDTARASLERAGALAHNSGSSYVGTEHILLGVLAQNSSLGAKILAENGVTLDRVELALNLTQRAFVVVSMRGGINAEILELIRTAWQLAAEFGQERIGTEHIVYGLLMQRETKAIKLLDEMNIDLDNLRGELEDVFARQQNEAAEADIKSSTRRSSSDLRAIEKFSIDLTQQAKDGLLDPVVGRQTEIQRMITILGRRSKNNPALIGEPGVGKTALVEGLSQKIADGEVPEFLSDKRIMQIDLAGMVAGTKYRGQFEERLQKLLATAKKHPEIILFIDEIHLIVGAGAAEGSMDAANVLKPALARGEIRVIGATTFDEYRKHIEKDTALARRFQSVVVNEPTVDEAVQMISGLSRKLAEHHKVTISDDMINLAVELSSRYLTERHLPDKAVDVIDEAAALLRSSKLNNNSRRQKMARQIRKLARQIDQAVESEDYELAANYKVQMRTLEKRAEELFGNSQKYPELTEDHLRRAVSMITQVPVDKLASDQRRQLVGLEKRLNKYIIGQSEAVSQLSRSIKRAGAGLNRLGGPLGSFVFLGPTGVGKTELARVLAREVFGGDDSLIKIDMSEFSERHTMSRLVGTTAGYVGYEDGGRLTDKIRRRPYSVVLFDEIEKAHPDVLNMLLQILEDGRLTDGQGRQVNFSQAIIILTSNVGADQMVKDSELGFANSKPKKDSSDDLHQRNQRAAKQALEGILKPELIGRFDDVITFRPLSRPAVNKIFANLSKELVEPVNKQGLDLKISPAVKKHLIDQGFDQQRGARVLRRTIQSKLGDPLSDILISRRLKPSSCLHAKLEKGKVVIDVEN